MISTILYCMMLTPSVNGSNSTYTHFTELPGEVIEVTYYYEDGSIRQTGYIKDGELTGTWTTFDESGNITAKGYYVNGLKEGKWKVYDITGRVIYKIFYRNGDKLWVQTFNNAGKVSEMALR